MRRLTLILLCMTLVASLLASPLEAKQRRKKVALKPGAAAIEFSDENVEKAIKLAIDYLYSAQNADGSWPPHGQFKTGPTAMATYALLSAGINPQEPRLKKALDWLKANDSTWTYDLGLRCYAWHLANTTTLGRYREQLMKEAALLVGSTSDGSYSYTSNGTPAAGDHSNSQYGLLGVWAAAADGIDISPDYWNKVLKHWVSVQCDDGGWQYGGKAAVGKNTMTVAGIATLYICYDYSGLADANPGKRFDAIQKGLDWLDKNFAPGPDGYYNYGVERVGVAAGYKWFGQHDWYKEIGTTLLQTQGPTGVWSGGWGDVPNTAFGLLFLIRGRQPLLFNKLQHDGDWDRRSRDLAAVTRWVSLNLESEVNWQIVDFKHPVDEWHDASILYITGTSDPKLTPEHLEMLKKFVEEGGTIFTVVQQGGTAFNQAMQYAYKMMFPDYPIHRVDANSALYTSYFNIKKTSQFSEVTNGARPLVVHCDEDLAARWTSSRSLTDTKHREFQLAYNVARYALDKTSDLPARGHVFWPKDAKAQDNAKTIEVYRIKYKGRWDPEPRAFARFKDMMAQDENIVINLPAPVTLTELPAGAKVAHMTGSGTAEFSDEEAKKLAAFVNGGGTLIIDSAGGNPTFTACVESLLRRAFPDRQNRLTSLSPVAPMFLLADKEIKECGFRMATAVKITGRDPQFKCVTVGGGRAGVIFSPLDLTCGLVACRAGTIDGYDIETAFDLMRNLVIYADTVQNVPGASTSQPAPPNTPAPAVAPATVPGGGGAF
ncbi:MAG: DUF4159 domain-containing protein [Planctomycetaceae bacterium]|nr:DUF4159 domain-containing protein [Planctomycetaceae bacterium]